MIDAIDTNNAMTALLERRALPPRADETRPGLLLARPPPKRLPAMRPPGLHLLLLVHPFVNAR